MCDEKILVIIFAVIYICFCVYSLGYNDQQMANFLLFLSCFGAVGIVINVHGNYYIDQSRIRPINQIFYV